MRPNESVVDLLLEVQALDRVPRLGYLLRGVSDAESISEHSWQVALLCWIIAAEEPAVDAGKALEMALIHDLAELRLGDLPRTAAHYLPPDAKKTAETAAAREILAPLGERPLLLFAEYEQGSSPEARLVKACDKLQLMLKVSVYESWGAGGLGEFWANSDNFPDGGFTAIRDIFDQLRQRRATAERSTRPTGPAAEES